METGTQSKTQKQMETGTQSRIHRTLRDATTYNPRPATTTQLSTHSLAQDPHTPLHQQPPMHYKTHRTTVRPDVLAYRMKALVHISMLLQA